VSKIVMGQSTPHWAQKVGDFLGLIGERDRIQQEQQRREAVAYLTSLPQEQRGAAFASMNPRLQKSIGELGFNAPLPQTAEQRYQSRLLQEREAALSGAVPAQQPATNPASFDDAFVARGAGVQSPDPYQQLQANHLRNSLITGRAPTREELDLGGAYFDRGNSGFSRANSISTGELPSGYQQGQLNETGRHNQETERQGNVRTGAYVNASGAQATASRALAGLRGEQTTTERDMRDPNSQAVAAQVAIGQGRRAPVVTPPRFIDDVGEFKTNQAALTKLSDVERGIIQQLNGTREVLKRFKGNREEQEKARRLEGQLGAIRTQLQDFLGRRDSLVTKLRGKGFVMKDEYQAMTPQHGEAAASAATYPAGASPLSDDMRAAIRALDPSISDQEIEAILNEGGSE
jgi:hypothetical protein